jgi:hypothetical protein
VAKYNEETILLIAGLADCGKSIREASLDLGIPMGSISTLATNNDVRFNGPRGRKMVVNPVIPYRPKQKQYYKKITSSNVDQASLSLMTRKW